MNRAVRLATCLGAVLPTLSLASPNPPVTINPPITFNTNVTNTAANPVPVTGNVTVSGSPNVQVVNPASSPVLGKDVDNPARNAWIHSFTTGASGDASYIVPSNKILTIEFLSVICFVTAKPQPDPAFPIAISVSNGGEFIVPVAFSNTFGTDNYTSAPMVRIYAGPSTTVSVSSGSIPCTTTASGNLITAQ